MPIRAIYNKDFFKEWSAESAYVLGFFCADGNLVKTKRGTHYIAWYSADKTVIQGIRRVVNSSHKISQKQSVTGSCFRLQIGSKEWFNDFLRLGIYPNKSRRMRLPIIPREYLRHFIRGYFDGDGNVWLGYIHNDRPTPTLTLQVSFTSGSHDFLEDLRGVLQGEGISKGSLFHSKTANFSRLSFSVRDALKIYEIMYTTGHKLFLKRKKVVFEKFVKMKKQMRA
jgi:intein-encoded DNA endonuclease-like protein